MRKLRRKLFEVVGETKDIGILHKIYDFFMMLVIIISILPLCFKSQSELLIIIDRVTVIIFIIDYILRWITYDFKKAELRYKAFAMYPFSFFAIIDLLSILPSITIMNSGFRLLKIFRLFKTFKVLKVLRYSKSFVVILNVLKKERTALTSVCYMALGYIFVSALVMFSVEPDSFETLFDAIYWATTALTTVGYGDIYPVTTIGRTVSMVSSLLGIAFVALPSGIITAGFMKEVSEKVK
ncbi:MAG: ion transporter [Mobilitalea sp.]